MMMSPTPSTSALVVLRRYHVVCRPIFEWRSGYAPELSCALLLVIPPNTCAKLLAAARLGLPVMAEAALRGGVAINTADGDKMTA